MSVLVEQRGDIAIFTLQRPEFRNAIDTDTGMLLRRALDARRWALNYPG